MFKKNLKERKRSALASVKWCEPWKRKHNGR